MRTYKVSYAHGNPDWAKVPALRADNYLWLPKLDIQMTGQACYNEKALFLRLRAWEKYIRAEHKRAFSMVCEDSCMEFFFRPDEKDSRYFNFEVNPNSCFYIGIGHNRHDSIRLCPHNAEQLFCPQAKRLPDGWEIAYRIPVEFIKMFFPGYELFSGRVIYANFYKCGDLTVQPHYLAWNPVSSIKPDFHRPSDFGKLVLE